MSGPSPTAGLVLILFLIAALIIAVLGYILFVINLIILKSRENPDSAEVSIVESNDEEAVIRVEQPRDAHSLEIFVGDELEKTISPPSKGEEIVVRKSGNQPVSVKAKRSGYTL